MTALTQTPQNPNYLTDSHFQFAIRRCPNVNFFLQKANIPGFASISPIANNPFTKIPYGGDHLSFDPLVIEFKVDEQMNNYFEIYNWLRGINFPEDWSEHKALSDMGKFTGFGLTSEITLAILDSNEQPRFVCTFQDAFPTSISGLQFQSTINEIGWVNCQVSFDYTLFELTKV